MATWRLDERDGELLAVTEREGPAARLGHRVTLHWTRWRATVTEIDGVPTAARLVVEVDSLVVRHGQGGLKPLGPIEKSMVRRSALRALDAGLHRTIELQASSVALEPVGADSRYELTGHLTICGTTRPYAVTVSSTASRDRIRYLATGAVRQRDFGLEPVSFFRGALVVTDEVTVRWHASRPSGR